MATKAVAAAPEAVSETSAKTQIADRPTEPQAVDQTRHADITTAGNAPSVVGEQEQDAEHISPASADNITTQAVAAATAPKNALGSVQAASMLPSECESITHPSDQNAPVLTSEQAKALFLSENYGGYTAEKLHNTNLDNFKEGKQLFGKFTAHLYDRVLPAINESLKRLKAGEEINGFSGERQVGAYLESIGYTAELVRQWNKRYRDRMAALKKALGLTDGNRDAKLTPEQHELRDTLMQQGYKDSEATRLAKAAEGNSVIERFDWVIAQRAREIKGNDVSRAINAVTEASNLSPAPTPDATESLSVTTVTHANGDAPVSGDMAADQLREVQANEPDRDVASTRLTKRLRAYAGQFEDCRIRIKELKVTVEFAGRDHRIMPGDFLEKRGQNEAPTLSKCTGVAEFMLRRRVQEWREKKWQKEHVIFSEHEPEYRVITEETARLLAPQAFPTPTSPEGL